MKNEFILAFNEVIEDRQLPRDVVMEALEAAMVSAYRKAVNASNAQHVVAKIDPESGDVSIYAEKEVVDSVQDERTEVTLQDALIVDEESELGGIVIVETTPDNFGRVAAQTARQVIQQRIREAEREAQHEYFGKQVGEIVNGIVQAVGGQGITLGLDKRAEGLMPRSAQIPGERFRVHDRVRALLAEVKLTPRGPQIILSRAHRNFLRRLLEDEVPEIYHGMVEVRSIAREPGHRSKVAVAALQAGIDPVGACVGIRGVRIQAIVRELNDEKIDVIEWNSDPAAYIAKALSPARVTGVYLNERGKGTKTATVVVPEDQLSLAIGRDGQNARLAAKLTGWRIDIKSLPEAASDVLYKFENDTQYAESYEQESGVIPQVQAILAKKAEGRPVTPEEYSVLSQLVDRVEREAMERLQAERQAQRAHRDEIRQAIPAPAFEMPLEELELSQRWVTILSETGYKSVGDLLFQMALDSDAILALNGIGPKAMDEIQATLASVEIPAEALEEPEPAAVEEQPEPVAEGEIAPEVVEAEPEAVISEEQPAPVAEVAAEAPDQPVVVEAEAPAPEPVVEVTGDEPAEEGELSLEELFAIKLAELSASEELDEEGEEEEDSDLDPKDRQKKKKRKYVEVEYDPDHDVTIVKRKRKRGGVGWEDEWEY
jgi:N utilization substance protein A